MPKKLFYILGAIFLVILIVVGTGLFVATFRSSELSTRTDDWGQFGDYFGGIMNPILACGNILVLWYLTSMVQAIEKSRDFAKSQDEKDSKKRELEFQKKLFLLELQQTAYKDLLDLLNKIDPLSITSAVSRGPGAIKKKVEQLGAIRIEIIAYCKCQYHLFPFLSQDHVDYPGDEILAMDASINDLLTGLEKIKSNSLTEDQMEELFGLISFLSTSRDVFVNVFQKSIISNLNAN